MDKRLVAIAFSVLLLVVNLPQADATLCGDTVELVVKDAQDNVIFSTSRVVESFTSGNPLFGGLFAITPNVDVNFFVTCDGQLGWDFINNDANNPQPVPEHSVWWNDLMWTDVPGGKVVDFLVFHPTNDCENPIETTGFTDTSAHAFVNAFQIPADSVLICDLKVFSQHPVGGEFIGIDSTMVLAAGAQYTAAWMIPVIVSGIGFAIVIARKF